jgi:hypothetical protein
MRFAILIWLAAFCFLHGLFGQDPTPNDLDRLRQQLRDAISGGSLAEASEKQRRCLSCNIRLLLKRRNQEKLYGAGPPSLTR